MASHDIDIDGRIVTPATRERLAQVVEALDAVVGDIDQRERVEVDMRASLIDLRLAAARLLEEASRHRPFNIDVRVVEDLSAAIKHAEDLTK